MRWTALEREQYPSFDNARARPTLRLGGMCGSGVVSDCVLRPTLPLPTTPKPVLNRRVEGCAAIKQRRKWESQSPKLIQMVKANQLCIAANHKKRGNCS